jgi:hypothetical protein
VRNRKQPRARTAPVSSASPRPSPRCPPAAADRYVTIQSATCETYLGLAEDDRAAASMFIWAMRRDVLARASSTSGRSQSRGLGGQSLWHQPQPHGRLRLCQSLPGNTKMVDAISYGPLWCDAERRDARVELFRRWRRGQRRRPHCGVTYLRGCGSTKFATHRVRRVPPIFRFKRFRWFRT